MSIARLLFMFAALVGVGLGLVSLRAETRQARYLLSKKQSEQQELRRQALELQMELARLRNPARLQDENERLKLELAPSVTAQSAHWPAAGTGD